MMKRIASLGVRSLAARPVRCYAAPAKQLVEIFESDFGKVEKYPVELLGGQHIEFSKLLFTFAMKLEGGKTAVMLEEFNKLDAIIAKSGSFWTEEPVMTSTTFKALNPSFKFVIGWMQANALLDFIPYMKISYKELHFEQNKLVVATIVTAKEGATKELEAAKKAIVAVHAAGAFKSYTVQYEYVVDASIGGGYTAEVGNEFVNKSAVAQAAQAAAVVGGKGGAVDYTALPAGAPRPNTATNDLLIQLLGAEVDDLEGADKAEIKYGA